MATGQAVPDVDSQAPAGEQIEHGQAAEASPIRQLIGNEVHAPDVIAGGRRSSLLRGARRSRITRNASAAAPSLLDIEPIS
jgi:hypothetical protein